jgi:hypothetical protein
VNKTPDGYTFYNYRYRDLHTISWEERRVQLKLGRAKRRHDRRLRIRTARRQKRYPEECAQLEDVLEDTIAEQREEAREEARIQLNWNSAVRDNKGYLIQWDSEDDRDVERGIHREERIEFYEACAEVYLQELLELAATCEESKTDGGVYVHRVLQRRKNKEDRILDKNETHC